MPIVTEVVARGMIKGVSPGCRPGHSSQLVPLLEPEPMWRPFPLILAAAVVFALSHHPPALAGELIFESITIDDRPGKVVYAVTVVDLNGNGREDIVAITEDKVLWYAAPDWEKHVIFEGLIEPDHVCIAAHDIDGDGRMDLAIGAGWPRSGGTIQWLRQGKHPTDLWTMHPIAAIPWTHRMRFANVLGREDKRPQLVVSPLNAAEGEAGVALTAFVIPDDPLNDRWPPVVLSHDLNRLHNHLCLPARWLNLPGVDEEQMVTLTASQEGVHVIYPEPQVKGEAGPAKDKLGFPFRQDRLAKGIAGDRPEEMGAGEIRAGKLTNGSHFIATIEPMHGHQAVVYLLDRRHPQVKERIVLTDQLRGGHAIWAADMDKDGDYEVIVGWREPNPDVGISIFNRTSTGKWVRQDLDLGGVAVEDLAVADLDVNGHLDIVAGGRATQNIKLYLNKGPVRTR